MDWFTYEQARSVLDNIFSMGWVKIVGSFFGMAAAWVFDDTRGYMPAVIVACLIALDSISGMIAAVINGPGLNSKRAKRILVKFIIYGIAIATGRLVDKLVPVPVFAVVIEVALGLTEAQSIIENCGAAGMPIPPKLKNMFERLKK